MIGRSGQWPWKEWLVDTDIFQSQDAPAGLELEHAVDQQEGKAVREDPQDRADVVGSAAQPAHGSRPRALAFDRLDQLPDEGRVELVARPIRDDVAAQGPWPGAARSPRRSRILCRTHSSGYRSALLDNAVGSKDQQVGRRGPGPDARLAKGSSPRLRAGMSGWGPARR